METNRSSIRHDENFKVHGESNMKWKCLLGLFFIEFFLSQLLMSYGVYVIYLIKENVPIIDILWSPLIFITCSKVTSPWIRDVVESYSDYYLRNMLLIAIVTCTFGISINFFSTSVVFRSIFYGGVGGISSNFIHCLVQSRIFDVFQYKTSLVNSTENFAIAFGLFVVPHLIHLTFDYFESSTYVYLMYGALLLNCLPAGLLLGKNQVPKIQNLTKYKSFSFVEEDGEELMDISKSEQNISTLSKNWKNPSDEPQSSEEHSFNTDEFVYQNLGETTTQSFSGGINILPQILEEDEDESDDDTNIFNKQTFVNSIKRLSTISTKLEELIHKDEEQATNKSKSNEIIFDVKQSSADDIRSEALILDLESSGRQFKVNCCSPYLKYRFRRRLKSLLLAFFDITITPLFLSMQVIEFYLCLVFAVHSLLSPLVFLNYMTFKMEKIMDVTLTEVTFMYSIIGFSYLCFLITLPWITLIPKSNLKYLYIFGSLISAIGIIVFQKTELRDYITLSCLIYGLGFGIENYTKEIVMINFLGVKNWSKVEGTLDCLSGVLILAFVAAMNKYLVQEHINKWFEIIFYSHIIMCCVWLVLPPVISILRHVRKGRADTFRITEITDS